GGAGDLLLPLLQQVAHPLQDRAALRRGGTAPPAEPLPRRLHRPLHVRRGRSWPAADQLAPPRWIAVLEVLPGGRGNPLAGDEVRVGARRLRSTHGSLSLRGSARTSRSSCTGSTAAYQATAPFPR